MLVHGVPHTREGISFKWLRRWEDNTDRAQLILSKTLKKKKKRILKDKNTSNYTCLFSWIGFPRNQEEIELFQGHKSDCLFVINRSVTSRFDTLHFLFEESRLRTCPPSAPNLRLEFFLAKYTTCIATRHPTRLRSPVWMPGR